MKGGCKNPETTNKSKDAAEAVRWLNEEVPRVAKGRKAGVWRAVEVLGDGGRKNTPGESRDPIDAASASASRFFDTSWASAAVFMVPGQVLPVFATHHESLLPRLGRGFRGFPRNPPGPAVLTLHNRQPGPMRLVGP